MIRFAKLEGLGNDFIVVDTRSQDIELEADAVRILADRRLGIGFDQLLELREADDPEAAFDVRIHNADGSPAEQCGNGMRALAAWLDRRDALPADGLRISTPAGPVHLSKLRPPADAACWTAELPGIAVGDGEIASGRNLQLGNPHRVVRVDAEPTEDGLAEQRALHPDAAAVNFGIARVIDRHHLELRVHERGAGPTPACGSGACAAAVAMIDAGLVESPVRVEQPGGIVVVDWRPGESRVRLTGPARVVFEGQFAWPIERTTPRTNP